jgi:diguanylate cyclase (GGDEF)-like protein
MIEISKIVVFMFVVFLFFHILNLTFFTRKKWKFESKTFILLIIGTSILMLGTFIDIFYPLSNNQILHAFIKICLSAGAIIYVIGMISWSNYTKRMILKFEEMALVDPLTGAYNRIGIERIFSHHSELDLPFYLVVCDLDGTKLINDEFGHLVGDEYIRKAIRIINDKVEGFGNVSRIGGDEFVIIFNNTENNVLEETLTKIKKSISTIFKDKSTGISIGFAKYPYDGKSFESLLLVADKEMYLDKEKNKNPVIVN